MGSQSFQAELSWVCCVVRIPSGDGAGDGGDKGLRGDPASPCPLPSGMLGASPGWELSRCLALAFDRVSHQEPDCDLSFTPDLRSPCRPHNDFSMSPTATLTQDVPQTLQNYPRAQERT